MTFDARRAVRAAGLFGLLVAVYFLVYSGWPVSGDEQVMFDGAHSFYRNGTLELGYFSNLRPYFPPPRVEDRPVLWLDVEPLQAYAAAGLMWLAAQLRGIGLVHAAWTLNLWVTALTAVVLYYTGILLGYRERVALAVALVFGLATIALPYSRLFFREPLFTLLALVCVYALERWRRTLHKTWIAVVALALAGALLTKGIGLLLIPTLLVVALPGSVRKLFGRRLVVIAALVAWLLALVVLYQQFAPSPRYRYVLAWLRSLDLSSIATAVPADLISPGFSLWIFSPVLLLGTVGAHSLIRARRWREFLVPLVTAISLIVGYSLFHGESWYSGLGWGPRYLLPLTPFLALWLLPVAEALLDPRGSRVPLWARAAAVGLLAQSLFVQITGAVVPVEAFGEYLYQESGRLDRMIYAWQDGTWNPLYTPLVVSAHQAVPTPSQTAWMVNHSGAVVLPLCLIAAGLGGLAMIRPGGSRRRLALNLAAVLVSTASAVGIGLRSFYADPRYGGDDPTLHRLVSELEPHPGDAVILNDAAYRTFFMNYYTAREPIYVMPDAPGERSEPGKLPAVVTDNPEEQAHPYTWVLLSRLARSTSRWLFVTEFSQYSPGRTRPTEHFLIRHYFLEHERQWSNTARLLIFQPVEAPPERQAPACPASVDFGAARLTGFDLPSGSTVRAGSMFPVSLVWSHQGWPADLAPFDYSVNVSLVSPEGKVVAQYAGSPLGTFGAMSRWTPGASYRDNHALAVPADAPPGDYELRVLVYDWRDGKPLPVRNAPDGNPHDPATIARVRISPVSLP